MSGVEFQQELQKLINGYGIDAYTGIEDWILAEILNHLLQDLAYIKSRKEVREYIKLSTKEA